MENKDLELEKRIKEKEFEYYQKDEYFIIHLFGFRIVLTKDNFFYCTSNNNTKWVFKITIPYFVFHKGKSIKKGRCFGYYNSGYNKNSLALENGQWLLISCYYFHLRICRSKRVWKHRPTAGYCC